MRALHRPQHHRHLVEAIEFAVECQLVGGEALEQHLERFVVHRAGLREIERVVRGLERRHAAADAELETPAAHLVEHADFLDQAQRMIERQQIDHRAEAQLVRCAAPARRETGRATPRSRSACRDARRGDSRGSRRGRKPRRAAAGRQQLADAARPHRPCDRRCRISWQTSEDGRQSDGRRDDGGRTGSTSAYPSSVVRRLSLRPTSTPPS